MAFLIPGDICDINGFILTKMDHTVALFTEAKVAHISKELILSVMRDRPIVAQALFWSTLVDEATLREWLVNIGQRDSYARMAHLFYEMWVRMWQVGLAAGDRFAFPLTQTQLGDTLGVTSVHVNRTIQSLRSEGIVAWDHGGLQVLDPGRPKGIAGFDPDVPAYSKKT